MEETARAHRHALASVKKGITRGGERARSLSQAATRRNQQGPSQASRGAHRTTCSSMFPGESRTWRGISAGWARSAHCPRSRASTPIRIGILRVSKIHVSFHSHQHRFASAGRIPATRDFSPESAVALTAVTPPFTLIRRVCRRFGCRCSYLGVSIRIDGGLNGYSCGNRIIPW